MPRSPTVDPDATWTEKELMETIRHAALECGWRYYHTQVSLYSARGFPDIVMVRRGRMLVWEIKGPKGKPTPAQTEWIEDLKQVPGVDARVIYPNDLDNAYQTLVSGEWPHGQQKS